MNDFSELENDLKKLRPAPVSPELSARIDRALSAKISTTAAVVRKSRARLPWWSLGLGLAAAAAVFLLWAQPAIFQYAVKQQKFAAVTPAPSRSAAAANDAFVPAGLTQVVYQTEDEGLVFADGGTEPLRRVRSQQRETVQWKNPSTGASLRVSYPSEEVRLIPVTFQ